MTDAGSLAERILAYLRSDAPHPVRAAELGRALDIPAAERRPFRRALRKLVADGDVYRMRGGRYAAPDRIRLVTGLLRASRRGHAFVVPDEGGDELYVPAGGLSSALDGDRVAARVEGKGRSGRPEGRVVRVIVRGRRSLVGRYRPGRARGAAAIGFVMPEDPRLPSAVAVPAAAAGEAREGDVVVVRVTDWGSSHRGPSGEIEQILGRPDDPGVDVLAVIHAHELPVAFPAEAEEQAQRIGRRGLRESDVGNRSDLRGRHVFTIDPPDARDHDDALSIEPAPDGLVEVGVHIADVSWYVRPGSPIDAEARQRATSVYLVDRAIPMIPEALSSDLCSLVPGEDRLTLSLFLLVDGAGRIRSFRLVEGVIRSRHKLSYDRVQEWFDAGRSIDPPTDAALAGLRDVSRAMRAARVSRGSLDFDLPETRVFLDDQGVPVDVQRAERWESHRLVEDLMLAANETIGAQAMRAAYPFIYRIHEPPDDARIEQLAVFAKALGFQVPFRERPSPADLRRLLEQRPGSPAHQLLTTLTLRSMKQARYASADRGHYGLAARAYTHFTSPIRRYPDLIVHRLVAFHHLGRGQVRRYDAERVAELARHSSLRERVAVAAERDSVDLKKVRFMERHVGSTFEGTISDVRPFGFFVRLDPFFIEGLVHVSSLGDDWYAWSEERFLLIGENTGRRFQVGQRVRVQVAQVDAEERRIDFVLAAEREAPRRRRSPGRRRR